MRFGSWRLPFRAGAAALGVAFAGCGSEPSADASGSVDLPIFGGQTATTCQWPTTVLLSGCTGTLVHPLIVTTAGHCGTNHKTATFGETRNGPGARVVPIEACQVYSGPRVAGHLTDWAYCKLAMPVTDVPIVPILMGCETDILKPGQKVVVAGFGDNTDNGNGFGTKRWVETTINAVDTGRGIQVGGMGKAPCFGDSGGPAFVKLADGSWRVFGVDSSGTGASCGAGDLMGEIHPAVPWIEQTSGVDITPCTDADGKWNPSAACAGFSLAPDSTGRSWSNGCAEAVTSGAAATCGPPFGGGDGGLVSDAGSRDSGARDTGSARDANAEATGAGGAGGATPDAAGGRGGGGGSTGGAGTAGATGAGAGGAGAGAGGAGMGVGGGGATGAGGSGAIGSGGTAGTAGNGSTGAGPSTGGASNATTTGGQAGTSGVHAGSGETTGCSCRTVGDGARSASGRTAIGGLAFVALFIRRARRRTSAATKR